MAQFIDTKRFQPVIYGGDKPHKYDMFHHKPLDIPKTEIKYVKYIKENNIIVDKKWWRKQKERCENGYTVENALIKGGDSFIDGINTVWVGGDCYFKDLDFWIRGGSVHISGRMYFYLNFWPIKRKDPKIKRKNIGPPRFTMLSWENWTIRELSEKMLKDLLWTKRRQCGLSEETACDLAYDFLFIRESQTVIVSGEEKYSLNTFRMVKRGVERLINTQFFKWTSTNNNELMVAKYFGSEMHCRTAKDNEQALSGLSPTKVLYEECGIWKRKMVRDTLEFVNQSLEAEGEKTGQNVFISTAGDMDDGVADVEYMFYNPSEFNLFKMKNIYEREETSREADVAVFIPGWKFEIIDEDGNNMKFKSIQKLTSDREGKNYKERMRAITMKPFYPTELFSTISGGYFGQDVIQMLNERKAYIYTHKNEQVGKYYNIKWVNPKDWSEGVDIEENEEDGVFYISEMPDADNKGRVPMNLYKAGTDSYDQDEANESNSKGSIHIFKGFKNASSTYKKFVARLTQRPKVEEGGAYMFYENTIKLCALYNVINLIEYSKIRIIDYYKRNGADCFLKERPEMVMARFVENSKTSNPYGIDPSTKPHWLAILKDYLSSRENINKLDDPEQIEALAKFKYEPGKKYNCDITISSSLAIVCYEDEMELEVVEPSLYEDEKQGVIVYRKDKNGYLKMEIV